MTSYRQDGGSICNLPLGTEGKEEKKHTHTGCAYVHTPICIITQTRVPIHTPSPNLHMHTHTPVRKHTHTYPSAHNTHTLLYISRHTLIQVHKIHTLRSIVILGTRTPGYFWCPLSVSCNKKCRHLEGQLRVLTAEYDIIGPEHQLHIRWPWLRPEKVTSRIHIQEWYQSCFQAYNGK